MGRSFTSASADEVETEGQLAVAELQIEIAHWSPADRIEVTLDEVALGTPVVRDAAAEDTADPSDVSENAWLCWNLTAAQVTRSIHQVRLCLLERDERLRCTLAGRTRGNLFAVHKREVAKKKREDYEEG